MEEQKNYLNQEIFKSFKETHEEIRKNNYDWLIILALAGFAAGIRKINNK